MFMDFGETVSKRSPQILLLDELVHGSKAKCLLPAMHKCSVPINGKIRVQITRAQPDPESTEIPSSRLQGLWTSLGGWFFISLRWKTNVWLTSQKNSTKSSKYRILTSMSSCFRKDHLAHKIIQRYALICADL